MLIPLFPLVACWMFLIPVLLALGLPPDAVELASWGAFAPLWFVGVYLLVIALVPLTWVLHQRFDWKTVIAFMLAAILVDTLVRARVPFAGSANVLFVWAGIHQIGYFWHDGRLPSRALVGVACTVAAIATLVALITIGGTTP